jgi:SAM-dependent methyltransferase
MEHSNAFTQNGGAAFSSDRMDWETPQSFFDELDKEFGFTLDPAASNENAKCDQQDLARMFKECFRVLKPYGVLIFKWSEVQIPLSQVLACTEERPIFGNRQPKRSGTHWVVFMKGGSDEV